MRKSFSILFVCTVLSLMLLAQQATSNQQDNAGVQPLPQTPVYRVNVVARNVKAVNYRHRGGSSEIGFHGTDLLPQATGSARVESRTGRTTIDAKFENLPPANKFGMEYLTYVLWAITPEGRAKNLGEVALNKGKSELKVTSDLQAFAMVVTAEPYFAVSEPSDVVVLENVIPSNVKGVEETINARYELLPRGLYGATNEPIRDIVYGVDTKAPLDLFQARNAVRIARSAHADRYASSGFNKAEQLLAQAEDYYHRKQGRTAIATVAREASQTAEEARVMSLKAQQDEQVEAERRAAAERAAQAQAQTQVEVTRRQQAEEERLQAERERLQAEQAKSEAERQQQQAQLAAQQAQQERQQAEAAQAAALAQQQASQAEAQRAQIAAQQAEHARLQAEQDKEAMRARLMEQLNLVLQTKDSARGLIVNMSDVLFDTGQATLKPGARERLAKVAGIILAYPDLNLQVEGHTDSVGSDQYNQRLSERRAEAVRAYLIAQGVRSSSISAQGFGKAQPIASNTTAAGRQLNRRVEMVVSGQAIGTVMSRPAGAAPSTSGGTAGTATAPGNPQIRTPAGSAPAVGSPTGTPPPNPPR